MENQNTPPDNKKEKEIPEWLQELQNKSWEPEIIISGLTLTFLFLLPFELFNFCTYLIQELNFSYFLSMLILLYGSMVITAFKFFFITHLILRFAWTGLVGISYAFPKGVIQEKAFNYMKGFNYPKPIELVIRLEKICSMMFALPTMVSAIVIVFPIVILVLGLVFILLKLETLQILYTTMGLILTGYVVYALIIFKFRKSKLTKGYATSFVGTVGAIYSTNLGKWRFNFTLIPMIILITPFVYLDLKDLSLYFNPKPLNAEWIPKEYMYESIYSKGKRFPKAFLKSEEAFGGLLQLQVAYYKQDEYRLETIQENNIVAPDSLNWKPFKTVSNLMKVFVDGGEIKDITWTKAIHPLTGQKIWQTWIDISAIPVGSHRLRINKMFLSRNDKLSPTENWTVLPFVKVK